MRWWKSSKRAHWLKKAPRDVGVGLPRRRLEGGGGLLLGLGPKLQ